VWRARHRRLGREVAVKYVAPELLARPGFAGRFLREARLLARVRHPGVVAVFDAGEEEGVPFLVMELVEGGPLTARSPLPVEEALRVAIDAGEALAAAHASGVIHRDVKPDNLLLTPSGRVVLVDFGIATAVDEAPGTLTQAGAVLGTPAFLPPEVLTGAPADERADVYALGGVLVFALTGQPPVGTLPPLPGLLDVVVRRAMAPHASRYPSMTVFLAALRDAARLHGTQSLPPEELTIQRAAAGVLTASSGVVIGAVLRCITPKVIGTGEAQPLVMNGLEQLADGRLLSRARFEEGAVLGAVGAAAFAALVWALLIGHWRRSGYLTHGGRVPQLRPLAMLSGLALAWSIVRRVVTSPDGAFGPFVPVLGGGLEVLCLAFFWMGALESARRGRSLFLDWPLLAWLGIATLPPIFALWTWLQEWTP
jgi:predicted Ser/Thr protein kinase